MRTLLFHMLCLSFKPMRPWFCSRTTLVRFQRITHFKFLRQTTLRHLNGHLDLSIYRLLNTCGTFLEGAFTPKWRQQRSATWGCIVGGIGQHSICDDQQIDQHHEETLYRCDRQKTSTIHDIEACVTVRMWPLPDVDACYALLRELSLSIPRIICCFCIHLHIYLLIFYIMYAQIKQLNPRLLNFFYLVYIYSLC